MPVTTANKQGSCEHLQNVHQIWQCHGLRIVIKLPCPQCCTCEWQAFLAGLACYGAFGPIAAIGAVLLQVQGLSQEGAALCGSPCTLKHIRSVAAEYSQRLVTLCVSIGVALLCQGLLSTGVQAPAGSL